MIDMEIKQLKDFDAFTVLKHLQEVFDAMTDDERAEHERQIVEYETERDATYKKAFLRLIGIPFDFWKAVDDKTSEIENRWQDDFRRACASDKTIMLINAKSGAGKTHFASWLLWELSKDRDEWGMPKFRCKYVSSLQAAINYKRADSKVARIGRDGVYKETISNGLQKADFIVVDEINMEKGLDYYERQFFFDLFNESHLGVLLCVNEPDLDMRGLLGDRVYERIHSKIFKFSADDDASPPVDEERKGWSAYRG